MKRGGGWTAVGSVGALVPLMVALVACRAPEPARPGGASPVDVPPVGPGDAPSDSSEPPEPPEPPDPPKEPSEPSEPEPVTCETEMMVPDSLSPEAWQARKFATRDTFSSLETSKQDPAKACGARDSYASIARLTCDDGSRPFTTPQQAAAARAGSIGPGGVCDNIIDLYVVPCPEGDVEVFVDLYWCPPGMSWR